MAFLLVGTEGSPRTRALRVANRANVVRYRRRRVENLIIRPHRYVAVEAELLENNASLLAEMIGCGLIQLQDGDRNVLDLEETLDTSTEVAITAPENESTITEDTPAIEGTGEEGATITVSLNGQDIGTTTVDSEGAWTLTVPEALTDGDYTVGAHAEDSYGNEADDIVTFTVAL